jgi:hypothetical protein
VAGLNLCPRLTLSRPQPLGEECEPEKWEYSEGVVPPDSVRECPGKDQEEMVLFESEVEEEGRKRSHIRRQNFEDGDDLM